MRSLRLLMTRRLSFKLIASPIDNSSCKTPIVMAVCGRAALERPLYGLLDVRFEDIADLHVVVTGQLDAALEAVLHFLHVVLHALQRFDRQLFGDDHAVAGQA